MNLYDLFRSIKKQGPLKKRGEFIQNWRDRYFILYSDGTFNGYRREPRQNDANPENNFSVNSESNNSHQGIQERSNFRSDWKRDQLNTAQIKLPAEH